MKKIVTILVTLVIILASISNPHLASKAYANSINTAIPVAMNSTASGKLSSEKDMLFYKFTTGKNSFFNLFFYSGGNANNVSLGWDVEIIDSHFNVLKKYESVKANFNTSRISLGQNTTFYVKVSASVNDADAYYAPVNVPFSIKAVETIDSSWEKELDNSLKSANNLSLNKVIKGTIWHEKDVDYYKYRFNKSGCVRFTFSAEETSNINYGWRISVYDKSQKRISMFDYVNDKGVISTRYNFKKGSVIYIKVEAADNHDYYYSPIDMLYSIKLQSVSTKGWERPEKNDSFANATVVTTSKSGTLYTNDDVDFYKFTTTKKARTIRFTTSGNSDKLGGGYNIRIYDSKKKEIKKCYRSGIMSYYYYKFKPGKTYYIRIYGGNYNGTPVDEKYTVKLSK